jgi:Holliday junction resolvase
VPSPSKAKGNRFEREVVNKAIQSGLTAKRAWGSNGASLGMHEEVDLIIGKDPQIKIQAKCRKSLASFLQPTEHVDAVVCKQDRGETLIILRFEDWLENKFICSMVEER